MFRRIILIKPCCIGDVIMATPLLASLRRAYPDAVIDWAAGSMSTGALAGLHEAGILHQIVDTGPLANPASKPGSFIALTRALRGEHYDLAVVPDRSPLLGLPPLIAGICQRAGLDSAGRGFSYSVKASIAPGEVRHEADIYLDVARALKISVDGCWASTPPAQSALAEADAVLRKYDIRGPLIIVHPGGGVNAGMTMTQKRWPAENFAALADRAANQLGGQVAIIGTETDRSAVDTVLKFIRARTTNLIGALSLSVIGALASKAAFYLGNDNGVAHLAAASGGKVLMIFGPSDPRRYAPFVPPDRARVAWKSVALPERGVSAGLPLAFDWARDGVSVDEAWAEARLLLTGQPAEENPERSH